MFDSCCGQQSTGSQILQGTLHSQIEGDLDSLLSKKGTPSLGTNQRGSLFLQFSLLSLAPASLSPPHASATPFLSLVDSTPQGCYWREQLIPPFLGILGRNIPGPWGGRWSKLYIPFGSLVGSTQKLGEHRAGLVRTRTPREVHAIQSCPAPVSSPGPSQANWNSNEGETIRQSGFKISP